MATADRPQTSRTVLGVMLLILLLAVLLALYFLLFNNDDNSTNLTTGGELPTAIPLPSATAAPTAGPTVAPTPTTAPTAVPAGFEACASTEAPQPGTTYLVATSTAPLNHRAEPSASAQLLGSYEPGKSGLVFNGECLINTSDGYTWWQIESEATAVWVASDFLQPN